MAWSLHFRNTDPWAQTRSSIGEPNHPVVNHPDPPSVEELHQVFINEGVPLAVSASQKAIAEARINLDQIVSSQPSLNLA